MLFICLRSISDVSEIFFFKAIRCVSEQSYIKFIFDI